MFENIRQMVAIYCKVVPHLRYIVVVKNLIFLRYYLRTNIHTCEEGFSLLTLQRQFVYHLCDLIKVVERLVREIEET